MTPQIFRSATALPPTNDDNVWEDDHAFPNNNIWAWAYPLGSESITNPALLNVSSSDPDYYSFDVTPGSYFSVSISFNQTNVWNATGFGTHPFIDLDPPFYADLDLYLWAENGTDPYLLGYSNYSGYEEAIGPLLVNASDTFIFNVTCSNPLGYESIQYSTTYNMSLVYEDKWEKLYPNDNFDDLTPPDYPGGSDDEIVPGHYEKLRLSSDTNTLYRENDTYWILLYAGSELNITVSSYLETGQLQYSGPDIYLYFPNKTICDFQEDNDLSSHVETFITSIKFSRWYYLRIYDRVGATNYYTLDISLEDAYEVESGPNNVNTNPTEIKNFGTLPGMVVSEDNPDWYRVDVEKFERLRVDVHWKPIKLAGGSRLDLNLTVYENQSISSILDDAKPILDGLRFGPYRAQTDSSFYFLVSSNNPYPLYYNLTVVIQGKDDWAEPNDGILSAYPLPTQSKEYKPTETNPDGGLISLEGNMDWFRIYLLPGDWISVRIDFNGSLADLNMFFADGDGNILDDSTLSGSSSETIVYNIIKADVYLLLILGIGPLGYEAVDYNISVNIVVFDDEFELPNNDFGTAAPIAEGSYPNLILRDDFYDYYYVYLHENDIITIFLDYIQVETNDIDLELYADHDGQVYPRVAHSMTVFNESLSYNASESGKYFIFCNLLEGETSNLYNLTIDILETDDPHEDNDVFDEATRLSVVDKVSRETVIHTETPRIRIKDDDYFVVNVPAGLAIIVKISQFGSENLDLELLSMNGSIIDLSTRDAGYAEQTGPFPINSSYTKLFAGTDIYFRVSMTTGLSTSYFLNVTIGPEDVLIPLKTVPPFSEGKTLSKPFNPFQVLIPLVVGGIIIGGGTALGLYGAKKTGALDKVGEKFRDRFGRKPEDGSGELKKPPS